VRIAASLLCAVTLAGYLGRWHWLPDACSHFRLQYLLGLGACLVLLALLRDWPFLVLAGACFAVNAAELAPCYVPIPREASRTDAPRLTLLCANVHNLNSEHERFLDLVRRVKPDVLIVVEATPAWVAALEAVIAEYPYSTMQTREDPFGIALYSRVPLDEAKVVTYGSAGVPSIVATLELGGEPVTIVATHPVPPFGSMYWRLRGEAAADALRAKELDVKLRTMELEITQLQRRRRDGVGSR
jgi:endonuclease/exonuclease/phosphatase (EEP) superfamily protein YafD